MPDPNNVALRDHDVVFMCLPKVANTSIKIAILKALERPVPWNVHQEGLFECVSKEAAKRFTYRIAFIRDPLTRLASCYQDKIMERTDGEFLPGLQKYGLWPGMPFLTFIERIAEIPDEQASGVGQHFRSQSFDLFDGDKAVPNWIGRLENIEEDWPELRGYLLAAGLDLPPLTCERRTINKPNYCPRGRAFATQRYKEDIRLFGYRRPYKYEIDPDGITVGRSICNVIRETYQIARDQVDDLATSRRLQELLAEAFDMGKRMNARLGSSQYEDGE